MPGATSLGIPYPYQNEPVTAQSWQDLATSVDALFTSLDNLQNQTTQLLSAQVSGGSAAAVALNVATTVTNYTQEDWDTGGYANLVAQPSRLDVSPGLYLAAGSGSMSGATTITTAQLFVIATGGAQIAGGASVDIGGTGGTTSVTLSSPVGIFVITANTTIQLRVYWNGTGGPANFSNMALQIVRVRPLFDV